MSIKIIFILLIGNHCKCLAENLEIKNLHNDSVLIMKIRECKIQTGIIKIIRVHPINLTNIENTIELINKLVVNHIDDKLGFSKIIQQKYVELLDNFYQIKPKISTRRKRWDALGTTWKWLAGNPDAQDLQIINSTMNKLISENNQQYKINQQIDERIRKMTETINNIVEQGDAINKILLSEIDMIATIINIETINKILEDIQDAIIRTKVALTSSRILTNKEIITIRNLLLDQGVQTQIPDEALNFVTPKVAANDNTLLYILQIPQLEEEISNLIQITPLIIQNKIIKDYPKYLIKSKQKLFTTLDHKNYVQQYPDIEEFKDDCIKPLVTGTRSRCNVTIENNTRIQFISEDKVLINNANLMTLFSDCGPDNRTLSGNFLITFWNCTLTINGEQFKSYEMRSTVREFQGALHNLEVIHNIIQEHNITAIQEETIQNRKHLEHVYLKQFEHQSWLWTLFGGLSLSKGCVFILIILLCCIKKNTTTIKLDKLKSDNINLDTSYQELRRKAGLSPKDVDALSSPPGEVICHSNNNSGKPN